MPQAAIATSEPTIPTLPTVARLDLVGVFARHDLAPKLVAKAIALFRQHENRVPKRSLGNAVIEAKFVGFALRFFSSFFVGHGAHPLHSHFVEGVALQKS